MTVLKLIVLAYITLPAFAGGVACALSLYRSLASGDPFLALATMVVSMGMGLAYALVLTVLVKVRGHNQ